MNPTTLTDVVTYLRRLEDRIRKLENQATVSTRRLVLTRQINGRTIGYTFTVDPTTAQLRVTGTNNGTVFHEGILAPQGRFTLLQITGGDNEIDYQVGVNSDGRLIAEQVIDGVAQPSVLLARTEEERRTFSQIRLTGDGTTNPYVIGVNSASQLVTVNETTDNVQIIGSP